MTNTEKLAMGSVYGRRGRMNYYDINLIKGKLFSVVKCNNGRIKQLYHIRLAEIKREKLEEKLKCTILKK